MCQRKERKDTSVAVAKKPANPGAESEKTTPIAFASPLPQLPEEVGANNLIQAKATKKKILQSKKKGLPVPPDVTFFYYGRPSKLRSQLAGSKGHLGVVTVAMKLSVASDNRIYLGISFCSPEDAFCKVKGRDLAMERLFNDPLVVPYLYEPRRIVRLVIHALTNREFKKLSQFGVQMPRDIERMVPGWVKGYSKLTVRRSGIGKLVPFSEAAVISKTSWEKLNKLLNKYPPGGAPIRIISTPRQFGKSLFDLPWNLMEENANTLAGPIKAPR